MKKTAQLEKALSLKEVNALTTAIKKADAQRFENSLTLAGLIARGHKWIKDAEGQKFIKEANVGMDEFILAVYGFQKSFYYKLLKAANVPAEVVKEFKKQTQALKEQSLSAPLSIEALLKYHNEAKLETAKDSEGEGEGEGEGKAAPEVKAKAKAVLTLAVNIEGLENVALRIMDTGELITTATGDAIAAALDYLAQAVAGAGLKPKKAAKPKAKAKALPKPSTAKAPKPVRKAEVLKAVQDGLTFEPVTMDDVL
jgi:hypothetical protein